MLGLSQSWVIPYQAHRGLARNRIVPLVYEGVAPETGSQVTAGDKPVGTFGSSADSRALALLRLDRVADAIAAGTPLTASGRIVRLTKPGWARFAWPGEAKPAM